MSVNWPQSMDVTVILFIIYHCLDMLQIRNQDTNINDRSHKLSSLRVHFNLFFAVFLLIHFRELAAEIQKTGQRTITKTLLAVLRKMCCYIVLKNTYF